MIRAKVGIIQQLMDERGWRHEDLAAAGGISYGTVRVAMRGDNVGPKTVLAFCRALNVPFDAIFEVYVPEMASV